MFWRDIGILGISFSRECISLHKRCNLRMTMYGSNLGVSVWIVDLEECDIGIFRDLRQES